MKSLPEAPSVSAAMRRARDDGGAGVGEHAEGVPLPARQHHLGVGKGGTALGHLGPGHHDGGAASHAGLFIGDELHRLLACRQLRTEERGREVLERESLGAIDHRRGEIFIAQTHDPLRELSAQWLGGGGAWTRAGGPATAALWSQCQGRRW